MKVSPGPCVLVLLVREWRKAKSSAREPNSGRRSLVIFPQVPRGLKSRMGLIKLPFSP